MAAEDHPGDILNPQEYREAHAAESGYRLRFFHVTVQLLPNPRRARYTYRLRLDTISDEPAELWRHEIATLGGSVSDISAEDEKGGLAFESPYEGGPSRRLEVRLRAPVRKGESYLFSYSYEAHISSVLAACAFKQTVAYSDWLMPNLDCGRVDVQVVLPPKAEYVGTVPTPSAQDETTVRYERSPVRALEGVGFQVAYRKRHLGTKFWQWVANLLVSGLVGALIAEALHVFVPKQ